MSRSCFAVALILSACLTIRATAEELDVMWLADPAEPPTLFATRVDGRAPVIDGKLDDAVWADAAVIERLGSVTGTRVPLATEARVCFDTQHIYVAFTCEEPAMDNLVVSAQAGEDKWPNNCVEVFIDVKRTGWRFWQFVTNHVDAHNDYGPGGDIKWNGDWISKAGLTDNGWCTEIAIPFTDLGYPKAPTNAAWGFNVTRERIFKGDGVGGQVTQLSTWMPIGSFSMADSYGVIVFGDRETYESRTPGIQLRAAVDRYKHSTLNPVAQVAVMMDRGKVEGSRVQLQLRRDGEDEPIRQWAIDDVQSTRFGIDMPIAGLSPGTYSVHVVAHDALDRASNEVTEAFTIVAPDRAPRTIGRTHIELTDAPAHDVDGWHVRTGVPFAEGVLTDPSMISLVSGVTGEPIPVQTRTMATWSKGGSIKWLSLNFQTSLRAGVTEKAYLRYGQPPEADMPQGITVDITDDAIEVDTGPARFRFRRKGFNGIDAMWRDGEQVIATGEQRGPYMTDAEGVTYWASADPDSAVIVEEAGPLMTIVRAEGAHRNGDRTLGRYVMRFYLYQGLPYCRVQHTFIITEDTTRQTYDDIGVAWPAAGEEAAFGLPRRDDEPARHTAHFRGRVEDDASLSLLQRSWDDFTVKTNTDPPRYHMTSDKAPGWIARGDTAILVKDFWQNFPKELEATRDALIVHMWPGHGETVWPMDQQSTPEHAWRLLFAHQGDLLDFNVPDSYYSDEMMEQYGFGERGGNYGPPAKKSNAIGVSRTHDMLFVFGDAAQPDRIEALNDAFQRGAHFTPEPGYLCNTDAAGPMHPYDPENLPVPEDYYSAGFDYLMNATLELNDAYGMFNYGDSFTTFQTATPDQAPSYYRLWAGYHHGRARVPWLLYMRSGDPKYLKWAVANARHLSDVDTCHYTTSYFQSHPWEDSRKILGAMCDYKGFVHWHTGWRTGEYNSQMDFLMYGYYLTGDRSLWDTLLIAGPCSVERGRAHPSRHGGGCLSSWVHYYQATWDPRALLAIKSGIGTMYTKPAYEHSPPSISWAPYLQPWIDMTGDPDAIAHLLEFADWVIAEPNARPTGGEGVGNSTRAMALAYRLTDNIDMLRKIVAYANQGPKLFQREGDPLTGYVNWYPWSYDTQNSLRALGPWVTTGKAEIGGVLDVPYWTTASGPNAHYNRNRDEPSRMVVLVPEKSDQPFTFGGRFGTYADVQYRFLSPSGKVIDEGTIARPAEDHYKFIIEQPSDGETGVYRFEAEAPRRFFFWYSNISTLGTQRFAIPTPDDENDSIGGTGRWYFHVPADCERFAIRCRDFRDPRVRTSVDAITPDDQPYRSLSIPYVGEDQWLEVEPPRRYRGRVWSLAMRNTQIVDVKGIAPHFAATPAGAEFGLE